ncbi:MAG TPA: hypothetical protein V6C72_04605 [Chroococcales cyanobacterium]
MTTERNPQFPLSNAAFDLVVLLHEKSKALQAYESYLEDVQHDNQLRQALVQIRHEEQKHVETLKAHLARLLNENAA